RSATSEDRIEPRIAEGGTASLNVGETIGVEDHGVADVQGEIHVAQRDVRQETEDDAGRVDDLDGSGGAPNDGRRVPAEAHGQRDSVVASLQRAIRRGDETITVDAALSVPKQRFVQETQHDAR